MTVPSESPLMAAMYERHRKFGQVMAARHHKQWVRRNVMHQERLRMMHKNEHREFTAQCERERVELEAKLNEQYRKEGLGFPCSDCGAPLGARCMTASGRVARNPHTSRRAQMGSRG